MNPADCREGAASAAGPRQGLFVLAGLVVLALAASVFLGSIRIPPADIGRVLIGIDPAQAVWRDVIVLIRVPKALTAVLAGAALAVAGLQMQTLFLNPLAGPFVLGINAGASLGVALIVLLAGPSILQMSGSLIFLDQAGTVGAAVLGAAAVLLLVVILARRTSVVSLIVLGLMVSYAVGAVVSLLMYYSLPENVQAFISWTFGSFGGVTWRELSVYVPVVLGGLGLAFCSVRPLNALLLGEEYAYSMGIDVLPARWLILIGASVLAGTITAYAGPIAFIGVATPHLCRAWLRTSNHQWLIPACILLGGTVALVADLIARVPGFQTALPLNAVTALLGAPVVVWALLRRQNTLTPFAS